MADFAINSDGSLSPIEEATGLVEKDLQKLIEDNLDQALRLTFIQSEYNTGKIHGGRIDTLSMDESVPVAVIIEYKNKPNKSVIIQVFYYFGWALDHRSDIVDAAKEVGIENADEIDIKKTRMICIAPKFTKEEIYMAMTLNIWFGLDIQLITFTRTEKTLTLKTATHPAIPVCKSNGTARPVHSGPIPVRNTKTQGPDPDKSPVKAMVTRLHNPDWLHHELFERVSEYILSFDGIEMHDNTEYVGFRKLFNLFVIKGYKDRMQITTDIKDEVLLELIRPHVEAYPRRQVKKSPSKYKKNSTMMDFTVKCPEDLNSLYPIIELVCDNN